MPAQNTLQNANAQDHVELKNLAIVDPLGKYYCDFVLPCFF